MYSLSISAWPLGAQDPWKPFIDMYQRDERIISQLGTLRSGSEPGSNFRHHCTPTVAQHAKVRLQRSGTTAGNPPGVLARTTPSSLATGLDGLKGYRTRDRALSCDFAAVPLLVGAWACAACQGQPEAARKSEMGSAWNSCLVN